MRNNTNNELEDYISEGTLALYETIDNYRDTTPYNIYLNRCLDNALKNAFQRMTTIARLASENPCKTFLEHDFKTSL